MLAVFIKRKQAAVYKTRLIMPRAGARAGATGDAGVAAGEHKPTTANDPLKVRSSSAFNFRVKDWARKGVKMPRSHQNPQFCVQPSSSFADAPL